jgi:hypothetical protein
MNASGTTWASVNTGRRRAPGALRIGQMCAAASLVAASALLGPAQTSAAAVGSNRNTFGLGAEADGVNVEVAFPGELPLVQSVSGSPWGASATLDSLGLSAAAAGSPYSPFIYSLPGTINGLASGQAPALPALPGEVTSSYPTNPTASQTSGPYSISARSGPDESSAAVANGASPPGSSNTTVFANARTVAKSDGSVGASAAAGVDFFDLGGLLDIGHVSSSETFTEGGSQPPTVSGRTNLGTVTLLGTVAGLVDHNLVVGGTNVPIPLSTTVLPALDAALKPVGVSLAYIPQTFTYTDGRSSTGAAPDPAKTLQAVDSGALQVTVTRNIPGQGTVTITYTLGRVFVRATNTTSAPDDLSIGSTASSTPGNETLAPGTSGAQPLTGSPNSLAGTPALARPLHGSGAPVLSGPAATPAFRRAITSSAPQTFYLILVVGALAALACSILVRHLGIRVSLVS